MNIRNLLLLSFALAPVALCPVQSLAYTITQILDAGGDGTNPFEWGTSVAVSGSGNVYISARNTSNVFEITPEGVITQIIDASGDGTNPFQTALGLFVDGDDNVYVSGYESDNAFRITPDGTITQILGYFGD